MKKDHFIHLSDSLLKNMLEFKKWIEDQAMENGSYHKTIDLFEVSNRFSKCFLIPDQKD